MLIIFLGLVMPTLSQLVPCECLCIHSSHLLTIIISDGFDTINFSDTAIGSDRPGSYHSSLYHDRMATYSPHTQDVF
jgi:hypothetical protein